MACTHLVARARAACVVAHVVVAGRGALRSGANNNNRVGGARAPAWPGWAGPGCAGRAVSPSRARSLFLSVTHSSASTANARSARRCNNATVTSDRRSPAAPPASHRPDAGSSDDRRRNSRSWISCDDDDAGGRRRRRRSPGESVAHLTQQPVLAVPVMHSPVACRGYIQLLLSVAGPLILRSSPTVHIAFHSSHRANYANIYFCKKVHVRLNYYRNACMAKHSV